MFSGSSACGDCRGKGRGMNPLSGGGGGNSSYKLIDDLGCVIDGVVKGWSRLGKGLKITREPTG